MTQLHSPFALASPAPLLQDIIARRCVAPNCDATFYRTSIGRRLANISETLQKVITNERYEYDTHFGNLINPYLVKKFSTFYETGMFITIYLYKRHIVVLI